MKTEFTPEEVDLIQKGIQCYKNRVLKEANCVDTLIAHLNEVNELKKSIELKLKINQ